MQMHVHVQMLVQTLIVARAAMRHEPNFAQVALLSYSMLTEICMHCDVSISHKQLMARPLYATPLMLPRKEGGAGGAVSAGGAGGGRATASYGVAGGWLGGSGGGAAPAVHSVFKVPGMHLLPDLLLERTGLKRLYDARNPATRERLAKALCKERFDAQAELEAFRAFANPHYALAREPSGKARGAAFSDAEDRLFATGIRRYGLERFDAIRTHLLPTKDAESLKRRYEQANKRRAASNPIKRARTESEPTTLKESERGLLQHGVSIYGTNWQRIRSELLTYRTEKVSGVALKQGTSSAPPSLPLTWNPSNPIHVHDLP